MNSKKKIMIIGAGILQLPAIIKAKEMGLEVIAIDKDVKAPGFKFADICLPISTIDIENAVSVAKKIRPDAVMTLASDMPVRTVAAIGEACGLATISKETALNATNKRRMREQLKKHFVPIPKFYAVNNYNEFFEIASSFRGKFIVKPADNSGSRGVFLVDKECDLKKVYEYSKKYSRENEVLIEEYMVGPEVSVEAITVNGETHIIAITDKLTTGAPYFVEMGHSIPSRLPIEMQQEIIKVTCAAIKAIGLETGPSHTEVIVTEGGPKIVEIGARLGGDNITTHLVPLATGIDMVECCIRLALGEEMNILPRYSMGAAIRYFKSEEGVLKSIENIQEVEKIDGVVEIAFLKKIGDLVTSLQNSTDRIGYVIARANSATEAIKICENVINMVKINVVKEV